MLSRKRKLNLFLQFIYVISLLFLFSGCGILKHGPPPGLPVIVIRAPHEDFSFLEELCLREQDIYMQEDEHITAGNVILIVEAGLSNMAWKIPVIENKICPRYLRINIDQLDIKEGKIKNKDRYRKVGKLSICFTMCLKEKDSQIVKEFSDRYSLEQEYETYSWRREFLKSNKKIKEGLIEKSFWRWARKHLPTIEYRYRLLKTNGPVKNYLDNSYCKKAYDRLIKSYPKLESGSVDEIYQEIPWPALYHAGIACECMAFQKKSLYTPGDNLGWFKKAGLFYNIAAEGTKDQDVIKAAEELIEEIELIEGASKALKEYLKKIIHGF